MPQYSPRVRNSYKRKTTLTRKRADEVAVVSADRQRDNNQKYAQAVAIHSVTNSRTASSFLAEVNDYSDISSKQRKDIIDLARKLRASEGICASVVDLLVDFAGTNGKFYSDNQELKILLNKWADFVNSSPDIAKQKEIVLPVPGLRAVARKIIDAYLTDGDGVLSLFWRNSVKMNPLATDAYFLPVGMKVMDSLSVTVDPDLAKIGIERLSLKIDDKLKKRLLDPQNKSDKYLKDLIPSEWVKFLRNGEDIILDPNVTYHFKRNAKDFMPYGESLLVKAFTAVANKRRLQAVDAATVDGLLNRITIFKLGLPDKDKNPAYHIPQARRVNALVDLLTDPHRMNAFVWPGPDLEVIDVGPDGKILEFTDKYKQADVDILRALHTSPLLIDGGSSGQQVRDWAAFLATEVGLDAIRSELEQVLSVIGQEIAVANKMDYTRLYYRFDTQMLKDEKFVRQFAIQVHEAGAISNETFLNRMGYDIETEAQLKENEQTQGWDVLFTNPFRQGISAPSGRPDGTSNPENNGEVASENPYDFVTFYFETYSHLFQKMVVEVKRRLEITNDKSLAERAVLSYFLQFQAMVKTELYNMFKKTSGGNITPDLQKLYDWTDEHLGSFLNEFLAKFDADPENIEAIVDSFNFRIYQYAQESYIKALWVGKLTKAKMEGKTTARIVNDQASTCELANRGEEDFPIDYLISNFPTHPGCHLKLEI